MERTRRLERKIGLFKASAFTRAFFVALAGVCGPEQYEAVLEELASLGEEWARVPYRYTGTLADEFTRRVRGRYGADQNATALAAGVELRPEIFGLGYELGLRIDGPARRRLGTVSGSGDLEALRAEVERLRRILDSGLVAEGGADQSASDGETNTDSDEAGGATAA